MQLPYIVGEEYNRKLDLHGMYGGSHQSGMCPCSKHPIIFLFTGIEGERHGYSDHFADNGLFWYTGEGQNGDMSFTKGNKALRDHIANNTHALLFEKTRKGYCRFIGEVTCIKTHFETRPDTQGNTRKAIIFELAFEELPSQPLAINRGIESETNPLKIIKKLSLLELRQLARNGSTLTIKPKSISSTIHFRSEAVRIYALERANGFCESCGDPAPFLTNSRKPFLEVHHLTRLADGGPDTPNGVAAICPNCHRRAHYGHDGTSFNTKLAEKIKEIEESI